MGVERRLAVVKKINVLEPKQPVPAPRKRVAAYARVSMETERLKHSLSAQIRNYKNHERAAEKEIASAQGAHSSPRPHVRAAHWHTFWVGPRNAKFPERKPIIRWLPPIPIGMDWKKELPTNIHMVLEN